MDNWLPYLPYIVALILGIPGFIALRNQRSQNEVNEFKVIVEEYKELKKQAVNDKEKSQKELSAAKEAYDLMVKETEDCRKNLSKALKRVEKLEEMYSKKNGNPK